VHRTKIRPPKVRYEGTACAPENGDRVGAQAQGRSRPTSDAQQTDSEVGPAMADGRADAAPIYQPIGDEWRRWIAENLMLGASDDGILQTMIDGGLSPSESANEIELAASSPYLSGAERVCNRLEKREWLLTAYRKLERLRPKSGEVERRYRLSCDEFIELYYSANRPVIITGMMEDWPALTKWNLGYFADSFGDREVEVQIGRDVGGNYEADREKFRRKMNFSELIQKVSAVEVSNDFYITASNTSFNRTALRELWDDIVQIPEYLDGTAAHNGFFWFGPAGTITPFHHDLTNNFMAQVFGRKRILLAPSWDMPLMRNLSDVYCEIDGRSIMPVLQPDLQDPQILECTLIPGELLFLPIGCLHFVEALEVSATVSFTNFKFDDNDFSSFYKRRRSV
jgi:hypothetical protein